MSALHIRFDGRSVDVDLTEVDLGDLSDDGQVRVAAATHLGVPATKLAVFNVDRNRETGDITLRPEAVFG